LWSPSGGNGPTASGLPANVYTVTVSDANGCTNTITINITQPAAITLALSTVASACGVSGGSATVTPSGGIGPYTYSWSSGITNNSSTITNLASGSYTVTVLDANACTQSQVLTINVANPLALTPAKTDLTCNNSADGQAGVTVTGGTGSYNYNWNPGGAVTATISGLAAGNYTVTVQDAVNNACTASAVITVNQPGSLNVTVIPTNIVCFGQANGTTTAVPVGGTPGYTYNWAPTAGTNSVLSGLSAGIYTVTLTDAKGCTGTNTGTVSEPPPLTLSMTKTDVSCIGAYNGTISTTVSGGTPAYTYNWAPSGGATGNLGGLGPGTYTLTVTDANGCTKVDSVKLTEPPAYHIATGGINPTCYSNNGSAYVTVTGGSGSFGFSWMPTGSTAATISGLGAGAYMVTVTDLTTGCDTVGVVSLAYPVVSLSMNSSNITCNGFGNGTAGVTASGAASPYTYLWSFGASTGTSISGLSPGIYSVTVNDNNGCVSSASVNITEPLTLSIGKSVTNVTCFNSGNGTATITPAGGTPVYTYTWAGGQTTNFINGLTIGKYYVTVTDLNGCQVSDSVQITQPTALALTTSFINVTCSGYNNGQVSVNASGGSGSYTYSWGPGAVLNDTIYNVGPGTYTVYVTDVNGCNATATASVTEPAGVTLTMNNTGSNCGGTTGTADVIVSGGNIPYTYLWSNSNTGSSINNLSKGTYTVTVTDNLGCQKTSSVTITEPNGIVISFSSTNISCNGASDGTITVSASGGTGSYVYSWIPSGNSSATLTGLSPGTYPILVSDLSNSNCNAQDSVTITQPAVLTNTITNTNVSCFGNADGKITVTVAGGTADYTYSWSTGVTDITSGFSSQINGLTPLTYSVNITDKNGCTTSNSISITEPTSLTTSTAVKQASCGNTDGKMWVTANGGTGSFTYSWSPTFSATDTLTGISSGKFYVIVSDANGCTKKDSATLLLSTVISANLTEIPSTCYGRNNAQIIEAPTGGSGNYVFKWGPGGSTNQNLSNLSPGMYTVTVSDATLNTCFKVDSILVTEPNPLIINPAITKTACTGNNNYIATANAAGGTPGYFYTWSFGGSNAVENNLSPGTYILEVQDANGCDTASIFNISGASAPFILPPTVVEPKCNFPNGSIAISVFGGVTPFSYSWGPSVSTTNTANNLTGGVYSVTVTDAYNCTNTRTISVTPSALPPNVVTSTNPAGCFGSSTGTATAVASAGSPPYTYSWGPAGGNNSTTTGLPAGTYTITVTDAQSCTKSSAATITQSSSLTLTSTSTDATCGMSDGSVSVSPGGGTPAYTFDWASSTGSVGTGATVNNVSAGSYTVTVSDNGGCSSTTTAFVNSSGSLPATITVTANVLCFSKSTGVAVAAITGGPLGATYTYNWSNSATSATANNLAAGIYSVTVTDQNGCISTQSATITEPADSTSLTTSVVNTLCGTANGSITVTATGGTPGYTYDWSVVAAPKVATLSNASAGNYTVTVTDNNGCSTSISDNINNTNGPAITVSSTTDVLCFSKSTGTIVLNVTGGTPAYTYSWTNGSTVLTSANLKAGIYSVTVTDQNGCNSTQSITITQPVDSTTLTTAVTNATCGNNNGSISVTANGGTPGYTYDWSVVAAPKIANLSAVTAGNYTVTVTDNNGCSTSVTAVIGNANGPVITAAAISNVLCFSKSTGVAFANVSGGTPGYTYSWSSGSTTATAANLAAGNYNITVTDQNGCSSTQAVGITQPVDSVTGTITVTNAMCGTSNGKVVATATGGTSGYSYLWNTGSTNATLTGLVAGSFTVTVTDNNGCSTSSSAALITVPGITLGINQVNNTCVETSDGKIVITPLSGTPAYTYNWSNGSTADSIVNLSGGNYSLTITDAVGCQSTTNFTIVAANSTPVANFSYTPVKMPVRPEKEIFFSDSSTAGSTLLWNFGEADPYNNSSVLSNPSHIYYDIGFYCITLTATNGAGCFSKMEKCIEVYSDSVFIPNVFSPNGDGVNDTYFVLAYGMKTFTFEIYDRWGLKVFEGGSTSKIQWDGRNIAGVEVPAGTYYYMYSGETIKNKAYQGKGFLELLR